MSKVVRIRRAVLLVPVVGLALAAAGSATAAGPLSGPKTPTGQPSSTFWSTQGGEDTTPIGTSLTTVYEGNTDQTMLNLVNQAAQLPAAGKPWTNVGPFKGVVDIPGTGSGNELMGPVDGIGTAIAVDPSDKTGNTAYLGTIGGLFKTTDGGKTVTDVGGTQLARDAIGAIAVDPVHPATVYAGTGVSIFTLSDDAAGAGVYVSHDSGTTWTRPAVNTHGYGVNAISVGRDGTVLVGTTYGLWRSTNEGLSFLQTRIPDDATHSVPAKFPLGSWVTSIARNPANDKEVTLAVGYAFGKKTYPDGEVIAPGNGLYRSTDDGASWSYMTTTSGLQNPLTSSDPMGRTSLAYATAPGGGNVLWALVSDAGKAAGNYTCVDTPAVPICADGHSNLNGVYRSGNDGATWQVEATPQILATAFFGATSLAGYPLSAGPGVQSQYNNWILADPVDPNRIYIGLEEAFTGEFHDPTKVLPLPSTTWTAVEKYANVCGFLTYLKAGSNGVACPSQIPGYGGGTTHPDQHSAAFASTKSGFRMYSGNDGGWWAQDAHAVTDDTSVAYPGFDNASWTSLGKPPTVLPWDVTRLQDGSYLLALQDNGVAHVRPDGTAYQVCAGDGVYVFPGADPSSYYCGIDGQRILATTDDMKTTIDVTPYSNATGATFLSPWTVDPSDPNHLLAAAGNVDETTDGANSNSYDPTGLLVLNSTWQTVFTPPNPPNGPWDSSAVYSKGAVDYVAFCSVCRPSLATGSAADASLVSTGIATNVQPGCKPAKATTNCWHWEPGTGLPHQQISGFAVDPRNPSTVYVSLRQMIVMGTDPKVVGTQKVMVSFNGGKSFTDLTGNLPSADAHRIELRNGQLYVATDVGIFTAPAPVVVPATPLRWSRFDTGLPQVTYRSMKLDPTGLYLVAGAYGRGGWVYNFGSTVTTSAATKASTQAGAGAGSAASATARPPEAAPASVRAATTNVPGTHLSGSRARAEAAGGILVLVAAGCLLLVARGRRQLPAYRTARSDRSRH